MNIVSRQGRDYRLPSGLNDFQLDLYCHLIDWKRQHITGDRGSARGYEYDAILPDRYAQHGEWPHIYPAIHPTLKAHLTKNPIRIHTHFYHMASSQAANINLFLFILHHPAINSILSTLNPDFVLLADDQLDHGYCLEYWGDNFRVEKIGSNAGPLRDKSPQAGTDTDIAIAYRNRNDELCLWLIEHKLTEKEFTTCGGFRSKGRKDKNRYACTKSFAELLADKSSCYYHGACGYNYWEVTDRHRSFFVNQAKHAGCPFQGGMNQLWRNQLLALALEEQGNPFKHAHFSVVHHPENKALDASLADYQDLIGNNPKFSAFTSADVLSAVEVVRDSSLDSWAQWYRELYLP